MRERNAEQKQEKYNFEKMKAAATNPDRAVRKAMFIDYFERFGEFPSYLFDNQSKMDALLAQTIRDLQQDPETSKAMQGGITALLDRLERTWRFA